MDQHQKLWWHNLPATKIADVTPSDTVECPNWGRAILVTADGNLQVQGWDDDAAATTFPVTAGQIIPIRPQLIKAATTAVVKLLGG